MTTVTAARPGAQAIQPRTDVDPATMPGHPLDHDTPYPPAGGSTAPTAPAKSRGIPAKVGLPLLLGMMVVGNVAVFGNFSPRTTAFMGVGIAGMAAAAAGYSMLDPNKSASDKAFMGVAGASMLGIAALGLTFALKH